MVAMFCKMVREPWKFCYIQVGCGSYVRKRKMNLVLYRFLLAVFCRYACYGQYHDEYAETRIVT